MKINLSMDVEDILGDPYLNNSVIEEICAFCHKEKIYCDLYMTGMRYEQLDDTNNDLINFIESSDYLEIGYHTNTHSFKTIPQITFNMDMDEINAIKLYEERKYNPIDDTFSSSGGLSKMKSRLKLVGFRAPNYAWTPQFLKYIHSYDFKVNTMDIKFNKAFLFMDMLNLPVISKPLEAMLSLDEVEDSLKGYEAVSLFLHPSRIIYDEFWDKKKERGIHSDWQDRLKNVEYIFKQLSMKYELVGLKYLNYSYHNNTTMKFASDSAFELLSNSIKSKWTWSQLPKYFFDKKAIELCRIYSNTFMPVNLL
ncbi:MAG: hypothetical protein LIR50_18880 [Bacillota bacterium]|nr:hypothetical protein [Bacillota bacterium]